MSAMRSFKLAWFGGAVLMASLSFYPLGHVLARNTEGLAGLGIAYFFSVLGLFVVPIFAFVGLVLLIAGTVRGRIIENARKINSPDA
jgi:hypothetical protein